MPEPTPPFVLDEATVATVHAAFANRTLTCAALVQAYLSRIEAYDRQGPALRALIAVNPDALAQAAALDRLYEERGGRVGALHGIPVILKDNFHTANLPTTAGSIALKNWRPPADAFVVRKMRDAGALILGKANLTEFARGGMSISGLGGQVRNPYDLTLTPGGSSGGTGAAIAANFALLGTGSDTGQSIRSPASACSLVGLRPTRGLVSRNGIIPNSFTQDEAGPIARTARDAAILLDAMAGYDPQDPVTAFGMDKASAGYAASLRADALKGARIGVLNNLFGAEARHAEVNRVMDRATSAMEEAGATLVRFDLPHCNELIAVVSTDRFEARPAFDHYLAGLGDSAPVKSFAELVGSRTATPVVQQAMEAEIALGDGMGSTPYKDGMLARDRLRVAVVSAMARLGLDALLYPLQRVLVAPIGAAEQPERNGALSHGTGLPAVTFPAGFSEASDTAPIGVPVGAEFLGRDYSEALLLSLALSFEQAAKARQPPRSTPPLA